MIFTGRNKSRDQVESKLRLNKAMVSDIGNYTCRLSSLPPDGDARGLYDTISVHVLKGENTEAIQSGALSTFQTDKFKFIASLCLIQLVPMAAAPILLC